MEVETAADLVSSRPSRPLVVAVDGASAAGTSTLAAAVGRRLGASVVARDDFYRDLPERRRAALSAAKGVDQYFNWQRMRDQAPRSLRTRHAAESPPYDWRAGPARPDMSEPADLPPGTASVGGRLLRLADAGDAKPAWITLLTTEHYNLQTQRAATISATNGRASIFLGAVSAGLIALGFQSSQDGRSGATTAFQAVVLSALAFLGVVTFLRCLETSLDDWLFARRIDGLRAAYAQLVPELAGILRVATGAEQSRAMLTARRQPFQMMLTVAGSIAVVTSILLGADLGVLVYGPTGRLWIALSAGIAAGLVAAALAMRFQAARWRGANPAGTPPPPRDVTPT